MQRQKKERFHWRAVTQLGMKVCRHMLFSPIIGLKWLPQTHFLVTNLRLNKLKYDQDAIKGHLMENYICVLVLSLSIIQLYLVF